MSTTGTQGRVFPQSQQLPPVGPQASLCKGTYSHGHLHELSPENGLSLELASSPSSEMREVALRTRGERWPWEELMALLPFPRDSL